LPKAPNKSPYVRNFMRVRRMGKKWLKNGNA